MKKLMKLLIATALVLTMAVCFAACGGKTMEEVYDLSGVKATAVATQTGYLSDFDDKEIATAMEWNAQHGRYEPVEQAKGEWVVFCEETYAFKTEGGNQVRDEKNDTITYTLYNVATEKIAAEKTLKAISTGSNYTLPSTPYRVVEVLAGEYSVGVYTDKGDTTIFYGENKLEVGAANIIENSNAGLVDVGDYIFKMVDGEVSYVKNETASIEGIDAYMNGYYFDKTNKGVTVYDANLVLYGYVKIPSYAYLEGVHVLANGNVLVQYSQYEDLMGDKYDVLEGPTEKVNYKTVLYNVEKNTSKEIKFDYVVKSVETENLAEKVDNIARLSAIDDKRINENVEELVIAKLSNNGKVGTIYGKAEDYLVNAEVEAIAENRFLAKSISGEQILYNEEMEKLATFSKDAVVNEQYIVEYVEEDDEIVPAKVYNKDGGLIVDLTKYDGAAEFSNGNMLFSSYDDANEELSVYLLVNGSFSKIATCYYGSEEKTSWEDLETLDYDGSDYYIITRATVTEKDSVKVTTYVDTIYNMNGEKLTETVAYEMSENVERKATVIRNRQLVLESEGLLVFSVEVKKYDTTKDKDGNDIGYANGFVTEYYYCK